MKTNINLNNTFSDIPYEIILLLDYREIKKNQQRSLYKSLKHSSIICEKRNLELGDIMWIARRTLGGNLIEEIVLDFIVERKKIEDLISSIEDGRYKEQKFRLKRCGLKYPIYLIEGHLEGTERHIDFFDNIMINTQIEDGFFIQRTQSEEETFQYLFLMTKHFMELNKKKCYENHSKFSFDEFSISVSKSKNLTISDIFAKQLLQLRGITAEKAASIIKLYPTPKSLLMAYQEKKEEKEKIDMLKNIEFGMKKRKLGPVLSKNIYNFYQT